MVTVVRNILAVLLGIVLGSAANMGLILLGFQVIPLPEGFDFNNTEAMEASIGLLEPKHFLFPFLAHALGTFVGALVAFFVAGSRQYLFALVIGGWFLAGGIWGVVTIPAPLWFIILDLVVAYFPMAWLAVALGSRMKPPMISKAPA